MSSHEILQDIRTRLMRMEERQAANTERFARIDAELERVKSNATKLLVVVAMVCAGSTAAAERLLSILTK